MPNLTAADIAKLPAHHRQQIEETSDRPATMSNKERARQQWQPSQATEAAAEERRAGRALTVRQRETRGLTATLRQAHETLHDLTLARFAEMTGLDDVAQAKRTLGRAIERLESL